MGRRRRINNLELAGVAGAVPVAQMPGFIAPQLATLRPQPPIGDCWIHEIKFDGYRS